MTVAEQHFLERVPSLLKEISDELNGINKKLSPNAKDKPSEHTPGSVLDLIETELKRIPTRKYNIRYVNNVNEPYFEVDVTPHGVLIRMNHVDTDYAILKKQVDSVIKGYTTAKETKEDQYIDTPF